MLATIGVHACCLCLRSFLSWRRRSTLVAAILAALGNNTAVFGSVCLSRGQFWLLLLFFRGRTGRRPRRQRIIDAMRFDRQGTSTNSRTQTRGFFLLLLFLLLRRAAAAAAILVVLFAAAAAASSFGFAATSSFGGRCLVVFMVVVFCL